MSLIYPATVLQETHAKFSQVTVRFRQNNTSCW